MISGLEAGMASSSLRYIGKISGKLKCFPPFQKRRRGCALPVGFFQSAVDRNDKVIASQALAFCNQSIIGKPHPFRKYREIERILVARQPAIDPPGQLPDMGPWISGVAITARGVPGARKPPPEPDDRQAAPARANGAGL